MSCCTMGNKAQIYRPNEELFKYSDMSSTECLKPEFKIKGWIASFAEKPFTVQRITQRSYLAGAAGYNAVFYVGDEGVLLVDTQSGDSTINTLAAIRSVTDLPVTAVVYSHYHLDHVAGVDIVIEDTRKRANKELRIIGTDITASRIEKFGNKIPLPTDVIIGHDGTTRFEDLTIHIHTPKKSGHCIDNAMILLKEEGIIQFIDVLEPECLPYPEFGPTEDIMAFEDDLKTLYEMDWTFINAGHGNIGYKSDVKFYLEYLEDLRSHTAAFMERMSTSDFVVPTHSYMGWWLNYLQSASALVKEDLRPKYGRYYGFEETVPTHIKMMLNSLILY